MSVLFNTEKFLSTIGPGRKLIRYGPKRSLFSQGGVADAVFYLRSGRAKLTVISNLGKEATVTLLAAGDFVGEEAIAASSEMRMATARAITTCIVLKIDRDNMLQALHRERSFSDYFLKFNSSERRLARILLMMADYGRPGEPETLIPPITQATLAEMIGTTRSRVSFFMNRFRRLGYIEYKGRIRVNKSLLKVLLSEHLHGENASRPELLSAPQRRTSSTKHARRSSEDD